MAPPATRTPRRAVRVGLVAAIAAGALIGGLDLAAPLERRFVDFGFATLGRTPVADAVPDIVVVGVDEPTAAALPEPLTLWHRHLGAALQVAAGAGARAVGVDLVLPDRSYSGIAADLDPALVGGILRMRQAGAVVLAISSDEDGRPRPIHAPFLAAAGPDGAGYALWRPDPDRVVRRFDERLGADGETVPTFAGQLARALGGQPRSGGINFRLGPGFDVLPLATVLDWARGADRDAAATALRGKVVLVGSVLPHADRVRVPVSSRRDGGDRDDEPGVLVQAQTLRTLLADRVVRPAPRWLAAVLAALGALTWLAAAQPARALVAAMAAIAAAVAGGLFALGHDLALPVAAVATSAALAAGARLALEAGCAWRERAWLREAFAGYVSPHVMADLEAGRLRAATSERRFIAVLTMDLRGFTSRSERDPPERILAMLNRLYDDAAAAIHARDGTIDKFMGDGILAFFGAPAAMDEPCGPAFDAAVDILERVRTMSETAVAAGEAPVVAGAGIACGEAIVGHVGTATRRAYTALGDCVNVAVRLETLTKDVGYPIVMTGTVAARLAGRSGIVPLGVHAIRGHSPLDVHGWRPS
ncbi:MAG: CHASE2 domain-containing protein [Burkholderiales bacterium]